MASSGPWGVEGQRAEVALAQFHLHEGVGQGAQAHARRVPPARRDTTAPGPAPSRAALRAPRRSCPRCRFPPRDDTSSWTNVRTLLRMARVSSGISKSIMWYLLCVGSCVWPLCCRASLRRRKPANSTLPIALMLTDVAHDDAFALLVPGETDAYSAAGIERVALADVVADGVGLALQRGLIPLRVTCPPSIPTDRSCRTSRGRLRGWSPHRGAGSPWRARRGRRTPRRAWRTARSGSIFRSGRRRGCRGRRVRPGRWRRGRSRSRARPHRLPSVSAPALRAAT